MRKTIAMLVAAAALTAALVAPAAAAPTKKAYTWNVTCADTTFQVQAPLGAPGWPVVDGKSPVLLMGGTFTITEAGVTGDPITDAVPAGLESRVQTCVIDGPVGVDPDVFHVTSDPAYMLFTG